MKLPGLPEFSLSGCMPRMVWIVKPETWRTSSTPHPPDAVRFAIRQESYGCNSAEHGACVSAG